MSLNKLIKTIKEWFKPAKPAEVTRKVHRILNADNLNYIKKKCAEEGIPVSEILLNAMKQGYKFDVRLKSEILEIFQKEGLVPVILI